LRIREKYSIINVNIQWSVAHCITTDGLAAIAVILHLSGLAG